MTLVLEALEQSECSMHLSTYAVHTAMNSETAHLY